MYLAQNLKYLREKNGMNQNEMADILGISQPAIGNWEQNNRKPDIEMIIRLAEYFGVSLDDLVLKELKPPIPLYASNLKYMRMRYGMFQTDIGKLIGVGQREISNYEKGEREIPVTKLIMLADFFGATLDQMVKQDLSKEM